MYRNISFPDINPDKMIEVIPSRNPDTDIRFVLPIRNYLSENSGEELVDKYWFITKYHQKDETVEMRLKFLNFKDNCMQGVRIDGNGSIVFMGKGFHTYSKIMEDIRQNYRDISHISLEDVSAILTKTRVIYGIVDRYNKKISEVTETMDPVEGLTSDVKGYGGFYYRKNISSAMYIRGAGQYADSPTLTPQQFEDGAFIVFQNFTIEKLKEVFAENISGVTGKIVQKDVFLQTRTKPDGGLINIDCIPYL